MKTAFRFLGHVCFGLILLAGVAWSGTALWLHLHGVVRLLAIAGLAATAVAAILARRRRRRGGWAVLAIGALAAGGWYQTIRPSDDRDWAIDVSRGVKAAVDGDLVTLRDIRDFDWRTPAEAEPNWITRTYDLSRLIRVDMLTSVWSNPNIAHLLVSFGFADGEHIVFSVEIRRERGEAFSEIGGFFRRFELVLIGAVEADIVRLRSNLRGEQVRLYPVDLTPDQRRAMFLSYVALAQDLERAPAFYNTLSANCTTVVYQLAQVLTPDLPVDWRLVFSAHLPAYLYDLGVLGPDGITEDRHKAALITARAQAAGRSDFSAAIRAP